MSAIDVEKLLLPVTDESPCGDDLEYDPAFQELERTASIDASASMVGGDEEPEPPNWREVAKQAETLLGQTKDLRAAMYLTKARLDTHGVVGLGEGIALIKRETRRFIRQQYNWFRLDNPQIHWFDVDHTAPGPRALALIQREFGEHNGPSSDSLL